MIAQISISNLEGVFALQDFHKLCMEYSRPYEDSRYACLSGHAYTELADMALDFFDQKVLIIFSFGEYHNIYLEEKSEYIFMGKYHIQPNYRTYPGL